MGLTAPWGGRTGKSHSFPPSLSNGLRTHVTVAIFGSAGISERDHGLALAEAAVLFLGQNLTHDGQ
jgi:hypothetical protein